MEDVENQVMCLMIHAITTYDIVRYSAAAVAAGEAAKAAAVGGPQAAAAGGAIGGGAIIVASVPIRISVTNVKLGVIATWKQIWLVGVKGVVTKEVLVKGTKAILINKNLEKEVIEVLYKGISKEGVVKSLHTLFTIVKTSATHPVITENFLKMIRTKGYKWSPEAIEFGLKVAERSGSVDVAEAFIRGLIENSKYTEKGANIICGILKEGSGEIASLSDDVIDGVYRLGTESIPGNAKGSQDTALALRKLFGQNEDDFFEAVKNYKPNPDVPVTIAGKTVDTVLGSSQTAGVKYIVDHTERTSTSLLTGAEDLVMSHFRKFTNLLTNHPEYGNLNDYGKVLVITVSDEITDGYAATKGVKTASELISNELTHALRNNLNSANEALRVNAVQLENRLIIIIRNGSEGTFFEYMIRSKIGENGEKVYYVALEGGL
jgi:hypothetical protein